jgi:hypothetical protein
MATCRIVCPSCEGKGFLDDGAPCEWCQPIIEKTMGKKIMMLAK